MSSYVELGSDQTTSAGTWVDLLSTSITVAGSSSTLIIMFSASGYTTSGVGNGEFRLLVDGVSHKGCTFGIATIVSGPPAGFAVFMVDNVSVAAGSRTVKVQWQSGGATIAASSTPTAYHAHLFVQEAPGAALDKTPVFSDISLPATTDSGGLYTTLVQATVNVTTTAPVLCLFSASVVKRTNTGTLFFTWLVDGVPTHGCSPANAANYATMVAMMCRPTLAAGSHTIGVEWKTDSIDANCAVDANQHARIIAQELAA